MKEQALKRCLRMHKRCFGNAVDRYRTLTRKIERISAKVLAFEPNAVEELAAYAVKLSEAYENMQKLKLECCVWEAEYEYTIHGESARVKACAEVREAFKKACDEYDEAADLCFSAVHSRNFVQKKYAPIVEAPVITPEQYELARSLIREADEQQAAAVKEYDKALAVLCEARKKYAAAWESMK